MTQPVFHSATLRLTAWYTLILCLVGLIFSVVLFQISSRELEYGLRVPRPDETNYVFMPSKDGTYVFQTWSQQRIDEGRSHLIGNLIIFNIVVLALGATGSYFLARRTLQPVKDALDSQTRFSSDAAHELRTPLTIMQSELEFGLRDKKASKHSYTILVSSCLDEVQRMRTLTDRLLMLANQNDMPLTPTSLEDVAIEAVNRIVPLAQSKETSVKNSVGPLSVIANSDSLVDVLVILLDNAIKYSPVKSNISVQATTKNKQAILTVTDNGPGIATQDIPHIFDRFYRADGSRSSQNATGHGLGLSIAKQIMAAHHGILSVANNKDGKGASFTVTIPLA